MVKRTCDIEGCERKHQARGLCSSHWSAWYRQQFKDAGRPSHHARHRKTCETCGSEWSTPRREARFCTAKCKGVHLSRVNRRSCPLPADHPVAVLIAEGNRLAAEARANLAAQRRLEREAARGSTFAWRTARECPGCACMFTPLWTSTTICCSKRCSRRVARWRRNASARNAHGSFTWSEFMRVAARFEYHCAYCGGRDGQLEPDHVVPLSRGGDNSTTNLLPSCRACNGDKRNLLLDEWATDRVMRNKPPRMTNWAPRDKRYWHLTQEALRISQAA